MSLNATLLGQMITFAFFVWFTMRFVWPLIINAIKEREKTIANGLAAAEKGVHELEVAQHKAAQVLREARVQAAEIIDKANRQAGSIVDQAKVDARQEGQRILALAEDDIKNARQQANQQLQNDVVDLAMSGVAKFLKDQVDLAERRATMAAFIDELTVKEAS